MHGTLSIKASGEASGQIRYQRITIDGGGEIAGDVAVGTDDEVLAPTKRKKKGHVA